MSLILFAFGGFFGMFILARILVFIFGLLATPVIVVTMAARAGSSTGSTSTASPVAPVPAAIYLGPTCPECQSKIWPRHMRVNGEPDMRYHANPFVCSKCSWKSF